MPLTSTSSFIASVLESQTIQGEFDRHAIEFDFTSPRPEYLSSAPTTPGVYFIIGERGDQLLKVYIGKAASVRRRMGDYHRAFQIHCPNDYKLAFFQHWLMQEDPGWSLTLRTRTETTEDISSIEADCIRRYQPLVNGTSHPAEEERDAIEHAFRGYFYSYFRARAVADA